MRMMRKYTFEAAHFLPNVPHGHKCRKLHGHSYRLTVSIDGALLVRPGWIMDFSDVDEMMKPVLAKLDHQLLNEVKGLGNPTAEHVARWIYRQHDSIAEVELWETERGGVIYRGAGK